MPILVVVNNPDIWPLSVPEVQVVSSRRYLTDSTYNNMRNTRVFNLCKSYAYQSLGYYVSLLAAARGHKPLPDIVSIQDMKSATLVRVVTDELDRLIQKTIRHATTGKEFVLSIYFGKTIAKRDAALGLRLFGLFRSPMLRAVFVQGKDHHWMLQGIRPVPASEISASHLPFVVSAAESYFARREWSGPPAHTPRYHMAILTDPAEQHPPSDELAIQRFIRAAIRADMGVEMITRDDFGRIGEFDALFIRTTTAVNHYTYRFARRAEAEGLAVIDDPTSIIRCTNKVYLAEVLTQNDVPVPKTVIVHRDNADTVIEQLGLPCILKQPDSAFSQGVVKVTSVEEFNAKVEQLLEDSDLVVAQSFMPTDYDWRVGVLDGEPLYACKYFMARNHWQILQRAEDGKLSSGKAETMAVEAAPRRVISAAVKAARLVGDGLYGVDLKQVGGKVSVIEVNDNPNLDGGVEDIVLKDKLYDRIIASFIRRIERIREGAGKRGKRNASESV